eukprot:XP_011662688.1 PREDICTED: tubulin polyglutamylase TTLL11 [Strongylocentrotus purpuratus]
MMSASSDGSNAGNGTKLEPIYPRSTHAQIAYEECLKNQIAQLLVENQREAKAIAGRPRPSTDGDAGLKPTPNYKSLAFNNPSSRLTADDTSNVKSKTQGKKNERSTKDEQKSRSRSGRRRRRQNILMVNTSKARSSGEVLRVSLNELGWRWKESTGSQRVPCDLFWNGVSFDDCETKPLGGMVNKFPGLLELVRKAQLSKLLHQMRQLFPDEYSFYPRTWILPEQYHVFCAEVATFTQKYPRAKPVFIVKPDDGCQGEGIYLISNPHHMSTTGLTKPAVVQEYIPRPLLLERLKFDLRIYVMLASIDPLRIYICKEGMARFCTVPYQEPTTRNLHVTYMHLTNYSLNKFSNNFVHTDSTDRGSKRTMTSVFGTLANRGMNTPRMWEEIQELVVKTITAMLPDLRVVWEAEFPPKRSNPTCFQIMGFDILLTSKLKPVLLEVNANPSLRLDFEHHLPNGLVEILPSPVDEEIKIPLITDVLRLLRPGKFSKGLKSAARRPVVNLDAGDVPSHRLEVEPTSEDEEDPLYDSCLEEIWPRKFSSNYEHLRIVERVAAFFNLFLGVRGAHRVGATGFRTFCRKCKLCGGGFSTAAADIMYIDVARRWNERTCEGVAAGMCFGAFLEAFFLIAKRKMRGETLCERVVALVEHCEVNLNDYQDWDTKNPRPAQRRLGRPSMAGRTLTRGKNSSEN